MGKDYSLVIVSYQTVLLEAFTQVFSKEDGVTVTGCVAFLEQAQGLISTGKPDVILLDCDNEERCLSYIQQAKRKFPGLHVVILTSSPCVDTAVRALEAGVSGYFTTRASRAEILDGIQRVLTGETLVCSSFAKNVMSRIWELAHERAADAQQRLTSREEAVSKFLTNGSTNREIADLLGVSERTVKHYVSGLIQKFSVRNRTQLVLAMLNPERRRDFHIS